MIVGQFKVKYLVGGKLDKIRDFPSYTIPYSKGVMLNASEEGRFFGKLSLPKSSELVGVSVVVTGELSETDFLEMWVGDDQLISEMYFNRMRNSVVSETNIRVQKEVPENTHITYSLYTEKPEGRMVFCNFNFLLKDDKSIDGMIPDTALDSGGNVTYEKYPSDEIIAQYKDSSKTQLSINGFEINSVANKLLRHSPIPCTILNYPDGVFCEAILPSDKPNGGYLSFDITCYTKVFRDSMWMLKAGAGKVIIYIDNKIAEVIIFPQNDLDRKYYDMGWSHIKYKGYLNVLKNSQKIRIKFIPIGTNPNAFINVGEIPFTKYV
jgi:hypothetical protein